MHEKIKSQEYERLDDKTKEKLLTKQETEIIDLTKNPIIIRTNHNYERVTEKLLKQLILEDISNFMKELGDGFSFSDDEYKLKIGDRYNYIDKNIRTINQEKTIGIIICRKDNKFVMEYCSDDRIYRTTYLLENI